MCRALALLVCASCATTPRAYRIELMDVAGPPSAPSADELREMTDHYVRARAVRMSVPETQVRQQLADISRIDFVLGQIPGHAPDTKTKRVCGEYRIRERVIVVRLDCNHVARTLFHELTHHLWRKDLRDTFAMDRDLFELAWIRRVERDYL